MLRLESMKRLYVSWEEYLKEAPLMGLNADLELGRVVSAGNKTGSVPSSCILPARSFKFPP